MGRIADGVVRPFSLVRAAVGVGALAIGLTLGCGQPRGPSAASATASDTAAQADTASTTADASAGPGAPGFVEAVERIEGSVVAVISTVEQRDDRGENRVKRGIGAGVVVSTSGEVLTNEHVVASASAVHVELPDLSRVPARVVYRDPRLDLALLVLSPDPEMAAPLPALEPVRFREERARRGEWVMAVGQPFGLGNTTTAGIVSGLDRDYGELGGPDGLRRDGIWSFIQTDASVNIGNSGGPLVDLRGEVVGITTAVRVDGQGLAFAIPVEIIEYFLSEVRERGAVRHPRLGIRAKQVGPDEYAPRMRAVEVTGVESSGPGHDAGLQTGDVIVRVDDEPIGRISELMVRVLLHEGPSPVKLTVDRPGAGHLDLDLVPERAP